MRRSVSVVVAYLVLVVAAFVGEFILVTGFVGYARGAARGMVSLVELAGQGPVRGVYAVAPYYYEVRPGEVRVGTGLHISLLNPNPLGTEVVLLGIYSLSGRNESQIVDLFRYGSPAEVDARGASFKAGAPSWWRQEGFTLVRYIAMEPHGFLSFVLVSRLPAPKEVLACTPVGCNRLEHLGPSYAPTTLMEANATWIILGNTTTSGTTTSNETTPPQPKIGVQQIWQWDAYTYAWEEADCYSFGPYMTPEKCLPAILCCTGCQSPCIPWNFGERGRCEIASGPMVAFSSAVGLPSNVIVGYYSEDPDWSFTVSGAYIYYIYYYKLSGVSFQGTEHLSLMPDAWDDYSYDECNTRYVTITIMYRILDENGNPRQFKDIWPNSDTIHWYAAIKTYQSTGLLHSILDEATIEVYRITSPQGNAERLFETTSKGTLEDESPLTTGSFIMADDYGVMIKIKYKMQLTQRGLLCGKTGLGGISCGDEDDHTVRLGFYFELIPKEWLRSSIP